MTPKPAADHPAVVWHARAARRHRRDATRYTCHYDAVQQRQERDRARAEAARCETQAAWCWLLVQAMRAA